MNLLQHIPEEVYGPVLVTLNPPSPVEPSKVVGSYDYEHPYFSSDVRVKHCCIYEMFATDSHYFFG